MTIRELEVKIGNEMKMEMEMVPERYLDIITGEFAYDPVRLPLDQDPTQHLYDRKTLQTIWETEQNARNPYTRQWFDIKSVIPQTELRREMENYINLHNFPTDTVIAEYSKILGEGEMKRHLSELHESVNWRTITEDEWLKIWRKMNIVRLFCDFDSQNIRSFISVNGFRYFQTVIAKILEENEAKEAALDVSMEIVRIIAVIKNEHGDDSKGSFGKLRENSEVILSLIDILYHVNRENAGYMKIQSFVLRAFSIVIDEISAKPELVHRNSLALLMGYTSVLKIFYISDARDISSEDVNHGIAILRTVRAKFLYLKLKMFSEAEALRNALVLCMSREIEKSKDLSGLTGPQLAEAQVQAQHNSEALETGIRLLRDIAMEESPLDPCTLEQGVDIIKELVHMF